MVELDDLPAFNYGNNENHYQLEVKEEVKENRLQRDDSSTNQDNMKEKICQR